MQTDPTQSGGAHEPLAGRSPARLSGPARALTAILVLAGLGAAGLLAFAGITARSDDVERLRRLSAERAIPAVKTSPPGRQSSAQRINLPGRLEPFARAELYARVSGYVATWTKDIGGSVKAGEVLAQIDAPDLDQQLFQAQSDLANAKVNEQLSSKTNDRYQALLPNKTISIQTGDEKAADLAGKRSLVKSAQANVDRIAALAKFKEITAPFDGTVIARNTDVGALINVGSTSGATPLFVVADASKLRLYINVPQTYAPMVPVGTIARVTAPELPKRPFAAKVEATSGSVDAAAGTVRMQLTIDNPRNELLPGGYVNVMLDLVSLHDVLSIPSSALLIDRHGVRVAIVDATQTVTLRPVTVARDLGRTLEISAGLSAEDQVIDSPPDGLTDGDRVRVIEAVKPATPAADLEKSATKG